MSPPPTRSPNSAMNINDAQTLKHRLEQDIAKLLHDYSTATNTTVRSVDLDIVSRLGDSPLYIVKTEVRL